MTLTGKQKAAILLTCLDPPIASELLKGLGHDVVQDIAVELAYLEATGFNTGGRETIEVARQFCNSLQGGQETGIAGFLNEMLKNTIGREKAEQLESQIQNLLKKRDPFMAIRTAEAKTIASALEGEHPQAAAVVLSELPAKKSSEVIGLLGEGIRLSAVGRMTNCSTINAEAKARIAMMISTRIEGTPEKSAAGAPTRQAAASPEQSLRKVAVILRNLEKELRDNLLGAIRQKSPEACDQVSDLMIVWDDIPHIADRSLQESLRGIDSSTMAMALMNAKETIVQKIRSNISERAAATLDEEASLMSEPKTKEVEHAREKMVQILREINQKGELKFMEE